MHIIDATGERLPNDEILSASGGLRPRKVRREGYPHRRWLVTTASFHSLPVSTTHVSVGSLFGMGVSAGRVHWRKVGEILLAWVSTVPCGAALAALVYLAFAGR